MTLQLPSTPATPFAPHLTLRGVHPPLQWATFGLAAFDMDSTLITIECIDELADIAGKKKEVAAITEAAMRGDITDFRQSLMLRLSFLKGLPETMLETVFTERLRYTPGAHQLMQACQKAGLKTLLVSGGFRYFAQRVQAELGMDYLRCNDLEIVDGCITGHLRMQNWGEVCDAEEKRRALLHHAALLGLHPQQCIAVGDGANDLRMMEASGLSVAFHAKPTVRDQAQVAITQGGLERLLELFC